MELQDSRSPATVEFTLTLEKLTQLIKVALSKRTPQLNGEKYLTNKDMDKLLHMSERTLQTYRDEGLLPYIKISRKILYKESDIIKLLKDNYVESRNYVNKS